ncbi:MAG: helix-turn-helix transcriptional regulator [Phycisphaeraceae bacterium]
MGKPASKIASDLIRDRDAIAGLDVLDDLCAQAAEEVYEARSRAGLSQAQLAKLVGTTQSAIARVEDADYDGHSLRTLARIASVLGLRCTFAMLPGENVGARHRG